MHIILRLFGLLKNHWKAAVLAFVFLIASTGASLVQPNLLRLAIDRGIHIDTQTGQVSVNQAILWYMGLGIVALGLLRAVFTFGQNYISVYVGQKVALDLRNRLYDRIQRLSFAFHDKAQTGQLMSRATQDVEAVQTFVSMGSLRIIMIALTFFGILGILLWMNWSLALVSLICIPPVAFIAIRMSTTLRPIWTRNAGGQGIFKSTA
jgi:ATP-binding cassette subfamily B protein